MSTLKIETREQFEAFLEAAEVVCRLLLQSEHCEEALNEIIVVRDGVKSLTGLYDALRLRWVPVSERLPEMNDLYLCMTIDDMGLVVPYVVSFFEGKFESNELRAVGGKVTHWTPITLPEES